MRPAVVVLVLAFVLLAGCASSPPASPTAAPGGSPAAASATAAWTVTDEAGKTWSDESLEGRPAVLFFMATWCGTCQATAPKVARLHETYGDQVQFLSIDFDPSETKADIEGWKSAKAQPWPHALDPQRDAQQEYDVKIQSVIVVLKPDGEVEWKSGYGPKEDDAKAAIERALVA